MSISKHIERTRKNKRGTLPATVEPCRSDDLIYVALVLFVVAFITPAWGIGESRP